MSPVVRRGVIVFFLAFVFLAGALAFDYWWVGMDGGTAPTGLRVGGPFTLTDQFGAVRHASDFHGKLMLVYFGYVFCPDACPTTLMAITNTMDLLGPAADQVQPIFITIDPERDRVPQMKQYASNFTPKLLALSGTPEETAAVAKEYRVYYQKVEQEGGSKDDYLMDHTALIYVMGRDGRFLTSFAPGATPTAMAKALKRRL